MIECGRLVLPLKSCCEFAIALDCGLISMETIVQFVQNCIDYLAVIDIKQNSLARSSGDG